MNASATARKSAERLFGITIANARRALGTEVFDFQPRVIQKALVAREILTVINGLDEETPAHRVREIALVLDSLLAHTESF